jgi:lipase
MPAMMSYWSELAREVVLPRAGTATTLVRAKQTSPPYVSDELIAGLQGRLGSDFRLLDFDCNHMVTHSRPTEVAALIRELSEAR